MTEKINKQPSFEGSFEAFELDLSSLDSVRKFAQQILAKNMPINVFINNAGIMFGPRRESKDGFELQLGTIHILRKHFYSTKLNFSQKLGFLSKQKIFFFNITF